MAKITVTITTHEEENTKFSELLKAARVAKNAAEELVDKTRPFIDAAGEAKFDEIVRQCNAFIERSRSAFDVVGYRDMTILSEDLVFVVYGKNKEVVIRTVGGTSIDDIKRVGILNRFLTNKDSFVATWNDFDRLGEFEKAVEREMQRFINRKEDDMRDRIELFDKITK